MLQWRIYYDDGSTFDGEPDDAPGFGVICIVQSDPDVGRTIMHRWDYYYFVPSDNEWRGSDLLGLMDRLCNRLPTEAVCMGRTIKTEQYQAILQAADKDPDFLPKSAKRKGESPHSDFRGVVD